MSEQKIYFCDQYGKKTRVYLCKGCLTIKEKGKNASFCKDCYQTYVKINHGMAYTKDEWWDAALVLQEHWKQQDMLCKNYGKIKAQETRSN